MKVHALEDYEGLAEHIDEVIITAEEIEQRVWELGQEISEDYKQKTSYKDCRFVPAEEKDKPAEEPTMESLLIISMLTGAVIFTADLLRAITIPVDVEFVSISSKTAGAQSGQKGATVSLLNNLHKQVKGRHVLVVEDIIGRGLTLNHILRNLRDGQPASLEVCTMFEKDTFRLIESPAKYKGFTLPDKFVVGYGLDYCEKYRSLPFVSVLKSKVIKSNGVAV